MTKKIKCNKSVCITKIYIQIYKTVRTPEPAQNSLVSRRLCKSDLSK